MRWHVQKSLCAVKPRHRRCSDRPQRRPCLIPRADALSLSSRSKLLWYSIIESLVVIGLSLGQVHLVRRMFEKGSTRRYRV
jgi:hypothetical protein